MDLSELQQQKTGSVCHVLAVPYPGRGHVNPMMNLCKLLAATKTDHDFLISFLVTEEWLGFIEGDPKPDQIRFRTIPNVLPSELVRGNDHPGFYEAVMIKMESPFEQLLDHIQPPVSLLMADAELLWAIPAANRRSIPVASLWTMSASVFSMFRYFDLIQARCSQDYGVDYVNFIPGTSPICVRDLPTIFQGTDQRVLELALKCVSQVEKGQFLLINTVYDLESPVIDALKAKFPIPVHLIGPAIPYYETKENVLTTQTEAVNYRRWLDSQPAGSVLYISLGSFLSVSDTQMEEIVAGVKNSGVRYLWVARGDGLRLRHTGCDTGLVVPWCDQLRVLCHNSIGGFWTHCGWNSTLEGVFAGVPMLTFPIFLDQVHNGKQIVEDWKVGWRVVRQVKEMGRVVTREEISDVVRKFMDPQNREAKEIRRRAREVKSMCRRVIEKGGSSEVSLGAFIKDITQCSGH